MNILLAFKNCRLKVFQQIRDSYNTLHYDSALRPQRSCFANPTDHIYGLQQFHKIFNMKHSNRIHRKREWCKSAVIWLEKTREIASIYFWRGWVIDLQVWIELNLGWLQPNQAKYIFNWNSSKQFLLLTFNLPLHRSVRFFRQRIYFCARIDLKAAKIPHLIDLLESFWPRIVRSGSQNRSRLWFFAKPLADHF